MEVDVSIVDIEGEAEPFSLLGMLLSDVSKDLMLGFTELTTDDAVVAVLVEAGQHRVRYVGAYIVAVGMALQVKVKVLAVAVELAALVAAEPIVAVVDLPDVRKPSAAPLLGPEHLDHVFNDHHLEFGMTQLDALPHQREEAGCLLLWSVLEGKLSDSQ